MTDKPTPEQDETTGRFLAGNSGNGGRKKGSRSKLGEVFLADLYADWENNGKAAIEKVRTDKPDVYLKVVASILPKDINVSMDPFEGTTDEELIGRLRELDKLMRPFIDDDGDVGDTPVAGSQRPH
jgi:hypothetical protein